MTATPLKKSTKPPPIIEFENVTKSFGENKVLKGVTFSVFPGEDLVILGRSGSGKSVAIKCLVGLLIPDSGEMKLFGTKSSKQSNAAWNAVRTRIGFLFQNGALYDSMSVRENLAFTLQHHDKTLSSQEVATRITEALENVGLATAIDKMPSELSGGMRKRIGLARTLIIKPELILYDEPTTGLDSITSREISELMLSIQKKYHTTSIIITHDMACAKLTGNRILILKDGSIQAEGTYDSLASSKEDWVRAFFI